MRRTETDGFPANGEHVLVDCGEFRCIGKYDFDGKWINPFSGEELDGVIGYYPLASAPTGTIGQ